jgi:Mce-associated membrane protein
MASKRPVNRVTPRNRPATDRAVPSTGSRTRRLTDFDKFADTNIAAIKQAQTSADVNAKPIGVMLLTDDRAELMVNLVVSANKDGVAQESASGAIVLRMRKKDGYWLASDIVDRN